MATTKFKIDAHLKSLFEKCGKFGHRSLLFVYGDPESKKEHSGEQIMLLHHLLTKSFDERPSVLWCHHKDSETPQVSKRILKKLEKDIKSGKCSISNENAFQIFLLSTSVKFCEFGRTDSVLGKSFGMCVIQDFSEITPNLLCRIIETVSGGGSVVFLLPKTVTSLKDLFRMKMKTHSKLKNYSNPVPHFRFNERFVLSLGWCKSFLILNNELQNCQELMSQNGLKYSPDSCKDVGTEEDKLKKLLEDVEDAETPLPQLTKLCRTMDQATAVLKMVDVITEKSGRTTLSLCAGRGRGKSAALGLASAGAIYFGLNNIYITSPSPENLSTYFEFLFKGFDALEYEEGKHYSIMESTNPEFRNAIIRVTVYARLRQVIQYVSPYDSQKVRNTELVIIDEAAAIPLTQVKALIGSHNVFMASTINGYEGTGRSLSLKLLKEIRQQTVPVGATATSSNNEEVALSNCRPLHELTMETSIRYQSNDPVEKWLYKLLCLNATSNDPIPSHCPHPDACELYFVNRNVLFSGHSETEDFLMQVVSLLVASHYKNSPSDLQMLADSPSQQLFVLIPRITQKKTSALPTVFVVIQVSLEGGIPSKVSKSNLSVGGKMPDGDLIPWFLAREDSDPEVTEFKGVRVLRIATHPDYQSMGYGGKAMRLLKEYYQKRFVSLDDDQPRSKWTEELPPRTEEEEEEEEEEQRETLISPRKTEEPLLIKLSERSPETVDYVGVSFGVTHQLFKFWKKSEFVPLYISQNENKTTGEHNCIMICPLAVESKLDKIGLPNWALKYVESFFERFIDLLPTAFVKFSPHFVSDILSTMEFLKGNEEMEWSDLKFHINLRALQRLESYAKNLHERHHITNLLRTISRLFYKGKLPTVQLSNVQSEIMLGIGLQFLTVEELSEKLNLPIESILGQFHRAMKRLHKSIHGIYESSVRKEVEEEMKDEEEFKPVTISLEQDLEDTAFEYKNRETLSHLNVNNLRKFAVKGDEEQWGNALKDSGEVVTIKSKKRAARMTDAEFQKEIAEPSSKKKKGMNKKGNKKR